VKNKPSRRRFTPLALALSFWAKMAKAQTTLGGLIVLVMIFIVVIGLVWVVVHKIINALPHLFPPPNTNDVAFYVVYDTGGEWPDVVTLPAQQPFFSPPPPASTFSFQYGMCSTNPVPAVWAQVGTNLIGVDPFTSNNITCPEGVLWTATTSDTLDVIYYVRNELWHSLSVLSNGNQVVSTTNLNLVVYKATPPLYSWQPVYTNDQPIMDYPYTFTDTNATDPAALYRVGWQ
jgi:hypothetical protein